MSLDAALEEAFGPAPATTPATRTSSAAPRRPRGSATAPPSRWQRRPASPWRETGLHYGSWYGAWEAEPVYQALPKSAQAVYRYLWTKTAGARWHAVPASRGSLLLGMWDRTWRRAVVRLQEAGLVDYQGGGSAHTTPSRYLARAIGPLTAHKLGAAPMLRHGAEDAAEPAEVDRPLEELLAPAADAPSPATDVEALPPALLDDVAQAHADTAGLGLDEALDYLRGETVATVLQLALAYGLDVTVELRPAPVEAEAVRPLAWRMVRDFHRRHGIARRPSARELGQAEQVVLGSGVKAWERYEAALERHAELRRRWRRAEAPRSFGHLWIHFTALGAVELASAALEDPPPTA